jgi:hypothetical protein
MYKEDVGEVLASRGISPLFVEERADETVSFWLGKLDSDSLQCLLEAIPKDAFALRARIVG